MKAFSITVNIEVPEAYDAGGVNFAARPICDGILASIQANPDIIFKGGKVDWVVLPDPTFQMLPE
jgi:hypothetical protein